MGGSGVGSLGGSGVGSLGGSGVKGFGVLTLGGDTGFSFNFLSLSSSLFFRSSS